MAKAKKKKYDTGVYPLPSGNWAYRFKITVDGEVIAQRRTKDVYGVPYQTKKQAVDARRAAIKAAKAKEPIDGIPIAEPKTVKEVFLEYCEKGRADRAYNTVLKQNSLWNNYLRDKFGDRYVEEISVAEVQDYLAYLYHEKGYAFRYVESFLKMFYLIFGQAYSRDYMSQQAYNKMCVNKDTKIHIPKAKVDERLDIVAFTRSECNIMDEYFAGTNTETAYLLGRFCGLRINECFGLKWDCVDLENGMIRIERQMQYQDGIIKLVTNGDYQYAFISEDAIEILRYTGNDSKLNVPESLDFLPVAHIGDEAFKGCSSLTNVVICEGIQYIGAQAFSGCCSLASINIPASVVSIADSAFEGCPASLVFIVHPNSAGHRWAVANHRRIDTSSVFFLYGFHTWWPERAVVEKYIGDGGNVALPHELDGYPVVCVWERAFRGCQSLTGIVFPEGLEDIAEEAFCCCGSLIRVILPNGLKCIGSWAFSECKSLSRVVIPASVTTIGVDAFAGCADDLALIVEKDSYAHHWAEEMRYPYLYPDDGD